MPSPSPYAVERAEQNSEQQTWQPQHGQTITIGTPSSRARELEQTLRHNPQTRGNSDPNKN